MKVRPAELADAAAVQAIYAPYVSDSTISFEVEPPDIAEMEARMRAILPRFPYFVAEKDGTIIGYAYASEHRSRAAYSSSIDVAVYVSQNTHRMGVGRALLGDVIRSASDRGFHAAFAGIALPNAASIGLHEALGFTPVGIYREVGQKFGQWLDVGWWQRLL